MDIVFAMILSIGIKGISAVVEIAIQMLITNGVGVSEYGNYTFFVSLIEGAYFLLFSGSIKLNTFYLSTPETNCQGLFHQIHKKSKKGVRSTVWLLTPRLIDYIFPFSRSLQRYAYSGSWLIYGSQRRLISANSSGSAASSA